MLGLWMSPSGNNKKMINSLRLAAVNWAAKAWPWQIISGRSMESTTNYDITQADVSAPSSHINRERMYTHYGPCYSHSSPKSRYQFLHILNS